MKALSIRQPWAWAILHCGKDVENRSWATKFRGDFLIHASLAYDREGEAWLLENGFEVPTELPRGGIVGAATITDCVEDSHSMWYTGQKAFVLANPYPLPFSPCKGQLGFFKVNNQ